ncbi:MAG TPA: VIT domain-containing protein [Allosphingosinicella sp.]|jgi:tetratricopeptide (TPR) repeat protein
MARPFGTRSLAALTAFLIVAATAAPAKAANPELKALVRGADDEQSRNADLRIEAMDVAVRLHGGIAETVVTARFHNPGQEILEGRFALQMPDSSIVTGYALDVGGTLVEGVLLDQLEARRAYEAQVRRNIDPGLGEVSRTFQFSTRIYPISPGSSRTVRVRFVTALAPGRGFALPLGGGARIRRLSVSVRTSGGPLPDVGLPGLAGVEWARQRDGGGVAWHADDVAPEGILSIVPAAGAGPIAVGAGPKGERFFEISDSAPVAEGEADRPRSVAVLWDRSLSRADDALADEIALVRAWLEVVRPASIELILFDSSGAERLKLADAQAVTKHLADVRYRGASSYAPLAAQEIKADSCLLFTDGLVTIDRHARLAPSCALTAVSSASDADRPTLAALTAASGGQALHLAGGNGREILERLTSAQVRVVRVRSTAGAAIDAVRLPAPRGSWRLVGPMPPSGGVVVTLSGVTQDGSERIYSAPQAEADWSGAAALWAADRLAVRSAEAQEKREALVAFARRYSVAGPDISFLVLETAADYARSKIEPPANFPADRVAAYRKLVAEAAEEEAEQRRGRLSEIVEAWEAQKNWWATRFDPNAKPDPDESARSGHVAAEPPPPPVPEPVPPPSPAPLSEPVSQAPEAGPVSETGEEGNIVITGTPAARPNLETPVPLTSVSGEEFFQKGSPTADELNNLPQLRATSPANAPSPSGGEVMVSEVTTAQWASNRPYMAALKAAAAGDRERVFEEQQSKHGALPAFWFDVAELAWKSGRREDARRLLLSALDLPTRNNETLAIVAERLLRYGEQDRAIEMFEAVAEGEPGRPQPLRSLALALADRSKGRPREQARADLARAIDLLVQVIMTPWNGDYDGIELIALMDVNRLIPRYRSLGGGEVPLDPRLIALLDVDIRVVIEWNTEETDLDLWVDEPNGERAYYDNQQTKIGGRISNDMTDGYGPEEYLLRRAPAGTFTIRADVYSSDELNPNGASRISARLIRNFGRPDEKEEAVEIELLPEHETGTADQGSEDEDDDVRLIGKIRIRR